MLKMPKKPERQKLLASVVKKDNSIPEDLEDEAGHEIVVLQEFTESHQLHKSEDKQMITYRKLVVPMSMRSIYWKYFGFPANDAGEILTKVKIVCLLCRTQIAYNRNTSNLRMHLQNKHHQELHDLEAETPPRKPVISQESKEKRAQKKLLKTAMANAGMQYVYTTPADGTVQIDAGVEYVSDPNINLTDGIIQEDGGPGKPIKIMIKSEESLHNSNSTPSMPTFVISNEAEINQQHQIVLEGKSVSEAVIDFIIMDMQLPEIVEGRGFQRLLATLKSPCEIPSKNKLEQEVLPKTYESFKESILQNISSLNTEVSLAVEEWKSYCGETFVTFLLYYQNPGESMLESKVLSTHHAPNDWTQSKWENLIDNIMTEWEIKINRVSAVVVSTENIELISAFSNKGLCTIPCLLHVLQVCAQSCFENEQVDECLSKCRTLIGIINSNPAAATELVLQEQVHEVEAESGLFLDHSGLWITTYNMLEQIHLKKEIIKAVIANVHNLREEINFNNNDWKILEDVVRVLDPFKITVLTLSEEKMPLISLLKPLLWQLVSSHLKIEDDDSIMIQSFKESLSEMLCIKFADPNVNILLQISTMLDPRFKEVPYASESDKKVVTAPIKDMLVKLIEENSIEEREEVQREDEPLTKKTRRSGMAMLLGSICATKKGMSPEEKANLELAQYQSEPTAALANCPLQWWEKASIKCPNLGKVAIKYNCIPACCPPPSRISVEIQTAYNAKRASIPPNLIDKLIFLHGNHTV